MSLTLTVCRDYRTSTKYEFLIRKGDEIVARYGFFPTATAARREGLKLGLAMQSLIDVQSQASFTGKEA